MWQKSEFFSLKPSLDQRDLTITISAHSVYPFWQGTNRHLITSRQEFGTKLFRIHLLSCVIKKLFFIIFNYFLFLAFLQWCIIAVYVTTLQKIQGIKGIRRNFLHKVQNIPSNCFLNKIFCKIDTYIVLCIKIRPIKVYFIALGL